VCCKARVRDQLRPYGGPTLTSTSACAVARLLPAIRRLTCRAAVLGVGDNKALSMPHSVLSPIMGRTVFPLKLICTPSGFMRTVHVDTVWILASPLE